MRMFFCTAPPDRARDIARTLVEERLVACVNVVPRVVSHYRWREALCEDEEALLIIKAPAEAFAALETRLRQLHPYEVFELLGVDVAAAHEPYARWVAAETAPGARTPEGGEARR